MRDTSDCLELKLSSVAALNNYLLFLAQSIELRSQYSNAAGKKFSKNDFLVLAVCS